jgi:hypothetical protein
MEDGKQDEKSGFSSSMAFSRNERFRDRGKDKSDPAPDLWRRETLGYTLSEGEQGHAKSAKNLYTRV